VKKAIAALSSDQDGLKSLAGSFVRFVCPLPSAFMTKISQLPEKRANAILVPSGDQAGSMSSAALFVRLIGFVPSALMT
jgi:hypothetical protein